MNTKSGCCAVRRRSPRPELRPASRRRGAPGAREDLVDHQHRHVAADAVALVARCRSARSSMASRSAGAKALSWTTSGQRREVRIAAAGEHLAARRQPAAGSRRQVVARVPWTKYSGCSLEPRMVGRDVVGHEVEHQPDPALGQRGSRAAASRPAAERVVDHVAADAVAASRSTSVVAQVRQRGAERGHSAGFGAGDRQPGRAALPDAHQPDRVDAGRGDGVPGRVGDIGQRQPAPAAWRQSSSQTAVLIS